MKKSPRKGKFFPNGSLIRLETEIIQDYIFMLVTCTCKFDEDLEKNNGSAIVSKYFFSIISVWVV